MGAAAILFQGRPHGIGGININTIPATFGVSADYGHVLVGTWENFEVAIEIGGQVT